MITYILSVAVTAIEKENAVLVVQEIVSHKLVDHNKVPGLLNDLLQIINPRKNPGRCRFFANSFHKLPMHLRPILF